MDVPGPVKEQTETGDYTDSCLVEEVSHLPQKSGDILSSDGSQGMDAPVNNDSNHVACKSIYPPRNVGDPDYVIASKSIYPPDRNSLNVVTSVSTPPVAGEQTWQSQSQFPLNESTKDPNTEDANTAAEENNGRHLTSPRERKKSKYLSYPFVDLGIQSMGLTGLEKSEGKGESDDIKKRGRPRRSGTATRSFNDEEDIIITASSAQLLMQLHLAAHDCLYPVSLENSNVFYQAEMFFTRFRASLFRGLTISQVVGDGINLTRCKEGLDATDNDDENENFKQGFAQPPRKLERKLKLKMATGTDVKKNPSPSGLYDVSVDLSTNNLAPACQNGAKRGRKRKKETSDTLASFLDIDAADGNSNSISRQISLEVCLHAPDDVNSSAAAVATDPATVQPLSVNEATVGVNDDVAAFKPSIDHMKHDLALMTMLLDKAGHSISTETRANLETEIKGLLNKVTAMVAGSTSSAPIC